MSSEPVQSVRERLVAWVQRQPRQRWVVGTVCCVLVALPYLFVTFPPATDLPQHVAQIRLLVDNWYHPQSMYRIQWAAPNTLCYALMGLFYWLAGPLAAGRLALMTVAVTWVASIHMLAARRNLPLAAATMVSIFVANVSFVWGFFNFVFGWPLFVVWLLLTTQTDKKPFGLADGVKLLATALLLFLAHVFWFAAAMVWLGLSFAVQRPGWRTTILRTASALPAMALAGAWYIAFSRTWYVKAVVVPDDYSEKINYRWWVGNALNGINEPTRFVVAAVLVGWFVVALLAHIRTLKSSVSLPLATAALMFAAFAVAFPYNYQHTIYFAERWLPFPFILGLLAAPPLPRPKLALTLALACVAVLSLSTVHLWMGFEQVENSGLRAAIDAVPENAQVVGLDCIGLSGYIPGRPFMHMPVYAQAVKGAIPSFSFTEFPHSLVTVNQTSRVHPPWTPQIEWDANLAKESDFTYFDYAIINADDTTHRYLSEKFHLAPVTTTGRWRLYKTEKSSS